MTHDLLKPKKKNKPPYRFRSALDFLLWLTVPMLCIAPLVASAYVFGQYYYQTHVYTSEDIAAICYSLALPPESAFCKGQGWQTTDQLREILKQTYPPHATSLAELQASFKDVIICSEWQCSVVVPQEDVSLLILHDGKYVTDYRIRDLRED